MIALIVSFILTWFVCVIVLPTLVHRYDMCLEIVHAFKNLNLPAYTDARWTWGRYGESSVQCGPIRIHREDAAIYVDGYDILDSKSRPKFEQRVLKRLTTKMYSAIMEQILLRHKSSEDLKRKQALKVFTNFVNSK